MAWRREPEIAPERQTYLAERRTIQPNEDEGIYPFAGIALTRADIEWLLATHEDGRGPVVWAEERDKEYEERRKGLDLRGADLHGVDLSGLPLTSTLGGLYASPFGSKSEQDYASGAHFEGANLRGAQLQGANLCYTHFNQADLREADLERAGLNLADLRDTDLTGACLTAILVLAAHMERANCTGIRAKQARLLDSYLEGTIFRDADLEEANLSDAGLNDADLRGANLRGARFESMFGQNMVGARLEGADLTGADLTNVDLWRVSLFSEDEFGVAVAPPTDTHPIAWRHYWWGQGMRWRTEPKITEERQRQLDKRRGVAPDPGKSVYPFKDIEPKLTRADLEWLLTTHENGRGPVDWADETQRTRWGLDLRGVDLTKVNLSNLPLARTRFGLLPEEAAALGFPSPDNPLSRSNLPIETKLENADLRGAYLEGALLDLANCIGARMIETKLERATLRYATLPGEMTRADARGAVFTRAGGFTCRAHDALLDDTDFSEASLNAAEFTGASLHRAKLTRSRLEGAVLDGAHLEGADLTEAEALSASLKYAALDGACLKKTLLNPRRLPGASGADLSDASLRGADLSDANLKLATLVGARLEGAALTGASLEGADLSRAVLVKARVGGARLEGASLVAADLSGADLRAVTLDTVTDLEDVRLGGAKAGNALMGGTHWEAADLKVLDWGSLVRLGEEDEAGRPRTPDGQPKAREERIREHVAAIRAMLEVAAALSGQGLREESLQLTYRAQKLQRRLHALRGDTARWLFSTFLETFTGYGYRLQRIVVAYVVVVLACAIGYYALGAVGIPGTTPLSAPNALLVSITAFHGRVFNEQFHAGSPQIWVTAVEAIAGLVLEGLFIAMLTQRFFGD
jgi:uncharacterized protein YjbI with pentapeptide repeats